MRDAGALAGGGRGLQRKLGGTERPGRFGVELLVPLLVRLPQLLFRIARPFFLRFFVWLFVRRIIRLVVRTARDFFFQLFVLELFVRLVLELVV